MTDNVNHPIEDDDDDLRPLLSHLVNMSPEVRLEAIMQMTHELSTAVYAMLTETNDMVVALLPQVGELQPEHEAELNQLAQTYVGMMLSIGQMHNVSCPHHRHPATDQPAEQPHVEYETYELAPGLVAQVGEPPEETTVDPDETDPE